jgi:senataxin
MASSTTGAAADGAPYASVLESLHQWRQNPDDVQVDKRAQQTTLEWLLSQDDKHWFCSHEGAEKSRPEYKKVLFDVATFTVRLIGFKSANKVLDWRNHVEHLLQTCHYCVKGWVKAQKDVGPRYLKSKWPEATVANWYLSLHSREVERVKAALSDPNLAPEARNLILYNVLCDSAFYSNSDIAGLLEGQLPDATIFEQSLPRDIDTPPGIVAYLVNPDTSIRDWSSVFISLRQQLALKEFEDKDLSIAPAVFALFEHVAKRDRQKSSTAKEDPGGTSMYTTNDRDFWHGLARVLEWLSDDIFKTHLMGGGRSVDIMRVVSGHLGDKGNHWIEVVRCFRTILERLDTKAWNNLLDNTAKNEASQKEDDVVDAGYAGARLHDALDNSQFLAELKLAQHASTSAQSSIEEALFGWIYYFLRSLRTSRFFHPCFSIVCNRLLDEYGSKALYDDDTRMRTLKATFKVFCLVFNEDQSDLENRPTWPFRRSTLPDLERRANIIAETAFQATPGTSSLALKASRAAQSLVHKLAAIDSQALMDSTYKLAALRASLKAGQKVPAIIKHAPRLCLEIYSRSEMQLSVKFNPLGAAGFVKALAFSAHLPRLSSRAWSIKDAALFDKYIKSDMKLINEQKEGFSKPISGILRSLANEDSSTIQAFLRLEGVAEGVMILVLCPTESIAMQAQSVLRQGYDVSSRIECMRALIEKQPEASLKGVIAALRSFKENANLLPEACAQAKRLVRCLTDVITVLCDPTDVMIRNEQWVERNNARSLISKLWNLMCNDIALIFEKTEHWAPAFENEEMTTWVSPTRSLSSLF